MASISARGAEKALERAQNLRVACRRLQKNYDRIKQDKQPVGISTRPIDPSNLFKWKATVKGVDGTDFEGATFHLTLDFPENFPMKPPKIMFRKCPPLHKPPFHPNIYPDGSICLDTLQSRWSPIYTITAILVSIQSLLADPYPGSPANVLAANMYTRSRAEYTARVKKECEEMWIVRPADDDDEGEQD